MKKGLKGLALVGLVVVLLAASVVAACGGGGETEKTTTVILGWLADQTGPSSQAFKELSKGMDDYLSQMEEADPIPGVEIKVITYDTRLEYARYPQGYQWLVGQGMDVLLGYTPEVPVVTLDDQAEDGIPQYNFSLYATLEKEDWLYAYQYSYEYEARAVLDYVANSWWPTQGKDRAIKVAHVNNPALNAQPEYQRGLEWVVAQNPGKISLTLTGGGADQSAWASEVAAVMDTDVVFMSTIGVSSATFLKELALRGYKGKVVGSTISILGVWPMVTSLVDKTKLSGLLLPHFYPLYSDNNSYSDYLTEMIEKYRPGEAAALKKGTTWMSGWVTAQILTEAVRLAAATVDAENVNGTAINDAFKVLNVEIEGTPGIALSALGVLQPYCRMIEYNAAVDDWSAITDWFLAPGITI